MQLTTFRVIISHQAVKAPWAPRCNLQVLGIGRLESRIANNLGNLAFSLERPLPLVSIRECFIRLCAPGSKDSVSMLIDQFAPNILLLDQRSDNNLNSLERPSRSHRWLVLSSTRDVRENGL